MAETPTCCTCPTFRPDSAPRIPNYPPVCDGDRNLIDRHLGEIANLIADLSNDEHPVVDDRSYKRFVVQNIQGKLVRVGLHETPADPLAAFGGVAPINSRTSAPNVSGSRERPIPIPVASVDLQAPARVPSPTQAAQRWPEDQIGYLSAATVLDQWVRDVRDTLHPDHHLPEATVDDMVMWLRTRVQDICDRHPAVVEFAEEIRNLRGALRSVAGETEAPPERCEGVACRRCDMAMLYRQPGGDVHCVNPDCLTVLRNDEYLEWTKTLAAEARIKRHAEQKS